MQIKTTQLGFSFLELIVIFALLALLGTFAVPNLFRHQQGAQRQQFLSAFQGLLHDALLRAVVQGSVHQIYIDILHGVIQIRQFDAKSIEKSEHKRFRKVDDQDYMTQISLPKNFVFKNFFINQIEEIAAGSQLQDVMFYCMPDGTSQAIIANLIDQDPDNQGKDIQFSFVINPFYARMSTYDTFQRP